MEDFPEDKVSFIRTIIPHSTGIIEYFSFSSIGVKQYVFITSNYFPSLTPYMQT